MCLSFLLSCSNLLDIIFVIMDHTSVQSSDVALPHDMPFFKPSIAQLGLRTPPPSPEDTKDNIRHHHSRFPLPKFLRRTQPTRSPTFLGQNGSSTGPTPALRSGNALLHPTCSPFRAVQHMKEPFPLVLPASPASSSRSADHRATLPRLRKVSLSYQNLRAFPPNQRLELQTSKPLALLPSPVFSELQLKQLSGSRPTTFSSTDQRSSTVGPDPAHSLYEEDGIVSSYYDGGEMQEGHESAEDTSGVTPAEISSAVKQQHGRRRDVGIVCAPNSFPYSHRHSPRGRSRSCSSEANWLSGTMSERIMLEEWLSDLHESGESPDNNQDDGDPDQHQIVSLQTYYAVHLLR